jgi:phage terminase small subunit
MPSLKSAKQEAFCQAICDGMNQSDAYRHAYNASKMKPETINSKAYELIQNGEITARIKELRGKLEAKQLWTREQSIKTAIEAIEMAKDRDRPADMLKGVEVLNKMHGYDAPIKHDVTKRDANPADLSDEELEAICANLIKNKKD